MVGMNVTQRCVEDIIPLYERGVRVRSSWAGFCSCQDIVSKTPSLAFLFWPSARQPWPQAGPGVAVLRVVGVVGPQTSWLQSVRVERLEL